MVRRHPGESGSGTMTGIIHALAFRHARAALKARAFLPPNPKAREALPHELLISSGQIMLLFPSQS